MRATVGSLRIKAACHELLPLALLPELAAHQKQALLEWLSDMEHAEVAGSTFADRHQVETETMRWIRGIRDALQS